MATPLTNTKLKELERDINQGRELVEFVDIRARSKNLLTAMEARGIIQGEKSNEGTKGFVDRFKKHVLSLKGQKLAKEFRIRISATESIIGRIKFIYVIQLCMDKVTFILW